MTISNPSTSGLHMTSRSSFAPLEDPRIPTILNAIRAISKQKGGGPLSTHDYVEWRRDMDTKLPSMTTVYRLFPSWGDAVALAGVSITQDEKQRTSTEDMIAAVQMAAKDLGSTMLSSHAYVDWREKNIEIQLAKTGKKLPSESVMRKRFKSWSKVVEEAGLEAPQRTMPKRPEPAQILHALRIAQRRTTQALTPAIYSEIVKDSEDELPDVMTVLQQFRSWEEALRAAEIEVPDDLHATALWSVAEARRVLSAVQRVLAMRKQRVTRENYETVRKEAKRPMPSWQVLCDLLRVEQGENGKVQPQRV